jgi:hypothetical protein
MMVNLLLTSTRFTDRSRPVARRGTARTPLNLITTESDGQRRDRRLPLTR